MKLQERADFDKFLKEKFEGFAVQPDQDLFEKIQKQMPEEGKRSSYNSYLLSVSLLFLAFLCSTFQFPYVSGSQITDQKINIAINDVSENRLALSHNLNIDGNTISDKNNKSFDSRHPNNFDAYENSDVNKFSSNLESDRTLEKKNGVFSSFNSLINQGIFVKENLSLEKKNSSSVFENESSAGNSSNNLYFEKANSDISKNLSDTSAIVEEFKNSFSTLYLSKNNSTFIDKDDVKDSVNLIADTSITEKIIEDVTEGNQTKENKKQQSAFPVNTVFASFGPGIFPTGIKLGEIDSLRQNYTTPTAISFQAGITHSFKKHFILNTGIEVTRIYSTYSNNVTYVDKIDTHYTAYYVPKNPLGWYDSSMIIVVGHKPPGWTGPTVGQVSYDSMALLQVDPYAVMKTSPIHYPVRITYFSLPVSLGYQQKAGRFSFTALAGVSPTLLLQSSLINERSSLNGEVKRETHYLRKFSVGTEVSTRIGMSVSSKTELYVETGLRKQFRFSHHNDNFLLGTVRVGVSVSGIFSR